MDKLKRARRKEQYLRIQASTLSAIEPEVAISLLEYYFTLADDFDHAQAYCDYASAYLALGKTEKALESYKAALTREIEFPKLQTDAYILYPLIIVENKLELMYAAANDVLEEHKDRLMFPIDYFRWYAAKAIIESKIGSKECASIHAVNALESAQIKTSGFRFHQNQGLVGKEYQGVVNELRAIKGSS